MLNLGQRRVSLVVLLQGNAELDLEALDADAEATARQAQARGLILSGIFLSIDILGPSTRWRR